MNVKELIKELKKFPEDSIVEVEGFDSYEMAGRVEKLDIKPYNMILIRNTNSLEKD